MIDNSVFIETIVLLDFNRPNKNMNKIRYRITYIVRGGHLRHYVEYFKDDITDGLVALRYPGFFSNTKMILKNLGGEGAQTDKLLPQTPFTGQFFLENDIWHSFLSV